MTSKWYREVLLNINNNSLILDVGIGTGTALMKNKELVISKSLNIIGIDIDEPYVKKCEENIKLEKLTECIDVKQCGIYDYDVEKTKFDIVYFSGSLMLIPNPVQALMHAAKLLKPNGKIFITQTVDTMRRPWLNYIKPHMKWLTTIDFGRVTYENEFYEQINKANLKIVQNKILGRPIGGLGGRKFLMLSIESK